MLMFAIFLTYLPIAIYGSFTRLVSVKFLNFSRFQ